MLENNVTLKYYLRLKVILEAGFRLEYSTLTTLYYRYITVLCYTSVYKTKFYIKKIATNFSLKLVMKIILRFYLAIVEFDLCYLLSATDNLLK